MLLLKSIIYGVKTMLKTSNLIINQNVNDYNNAVHQISQNQIYRERDIIEGFNERKQLFQNVNEYALYVLKPATKELKRTVYINSCLVDLTVKEII